MGESSYFKGLNAIDGERYYKKLTLSNGHRLPDPYGIKVGWTDDIAKLPSISWRDVTEYLIDTPSVYTKESMKAYKSLEAFGYFQCGHVQDCYYNEISPEEEFCVIKSEVLPSQRQGKSSSLYSVWVCLHKQHGWVLTANCSCMAGLGSACSHVAALLFKLEAAVHFKLNEPTAATSQLCAWKVCKKFVTPSLLKEIDFKRPKKVNLPSTFQANEDLAISYSCNDPSIGEFPISEAELLELHNTTSEAAVFTSKVDILPIEEKSASDTDSDGENDTNCIPETLISLFDPCAVNLTESELIQLSQKKYEMFQRSYNQTAYNNLCSITLKQSESAVWMMHRAGRLTASICQQVYNTNDSSPSKSILKAIMQYNTPFENKYTKYGKDMESTAREYYNNLMKPHHENLQVRETGFHVKSDKPFLGASPDAIITCNCHEDRVLEIKCPYKYKNGLNGWKNDKDFPINPDYTIKKKHKYYYQIQQQILITGIQKGVLLVYTPTDSLMCSVSYNVELMRKVEAKLNGIFFDHILPEIVSRKQDVNNDQERKLYCICKRPSFGPMIACDNPSCPGEWYHYSCVHITRAPKGKWYCRNCKISVKEKRN